MSVSMLQERPPLIRFDYEEVGTDAEASQKAGRPIPLVKEIVIIVQHGDKHSEFHKIAPDWLAQVRQMAIEGRYNPDWVKRFEMQYEEWKKGNEIPREGTPVKTWHALNKEQAIRLVAIGITTVEDLAEYPDSGLGMIGLDGRYLRDLAKNFIAQGLKGIDAKRLADLELRNREQQETIDSLTARLASIEKGKGKV